MGARKNCIVEAFLNTHHQHIFIEKYKKTKLIIIKYALNLHYFFYEDVKKEREKAMIFPASINGLREEKI